jgi:hypothetical protein
MFDGPIQRFVGGMFRGSKLFLWMPLGFLLPMLVRQDMALAVPASPTLQDLQIAGRVLAFQDPRPAPDVTVAIVFDPADPASRQEADALVGLIGPGLTVGDLVLHAVRTEQGQLAGLGTANAVLATAGVNQAVLGSALSRRRIACLTRHPDQVEHGACTVAICTEPSVEIVVNERNAGADGVRFATAFRMMVREL